MDIRRKLFDYIRVADEKKVKAIYTMIENDIEENKDVWTDEFFKEMDRRTEEYEKGKIKGTPWEIVKQRAKQSLKTKSS